MAPQDRGSRPGDRYAPPRADPREPPDVVQVAGGDLLLVPAQVLVELLRLLGRVEVATRPRRPRDAYVLKSLHSRWTWVGDAVHRAIERILRRVGEGAGGGGLGLDPVGKVDRRPRDRAADARHARPVPGVARGPLPRRPQALVRARRARVRRVRPRRRVEGDEPSGRARPARVPRLPPLRASCRPPTRRPGCPSSSSTRSTSRGRPSGRRSTSPGARRGAPRSTTGRRARSASTRTRSSCSSTRSSCRRSTGSPRRTSSAASCTSTRAPPTRSARPTPSLEDAKRTVRASIAEMRQRLAMGGGADPSKLAFPMTDDLERCAGCNFRRLCGR